jgi:hypothetical protein
MADNTDEELFDNPTNTQSENPSVQITSTTNKDNINPNQETENMEVHAHDLHKAPGHGWKHYIFEFLMLFLAVFCGFLAENFREHQVEKEREEKFIKNLVEDLKQDTIAFTKNINYISVLLEKDDSLINLLNSPNVKKFGSALYYTGRLSSRSTPLAINDATIQQLKNSGGFRLIQNEAVSKKIMEYYNRIVFINYLQQVELLESEDYRKIAIDVFHPLLFNSIASITVNSIVRLSGNPELLTYDQQTLTRLSGTVSYHRSAKFAISDAQSDMNKAAIKLIELIKNEYHLE